IAPYALHCSPDASSLAGSQAFRTAIAAAFTGMLTRSPLGGVTIRYRQSSVTTETQKPVTSADAFVLGVPAGVCPRPRCARAGTEPDDKRTAVTTPTRH